MVPFLVVFVGAGIGGALRHGINVAVFRWLGLNLPFATLFINATGSFAMGVVIGYFALWSTSSDQHLRLFVTTGILGGYTTFSTFSLDAASLWESGQPRAAVLYVALSVGVSLAAMFLGLWLMRSLWR